MRILLLEVIGEGERNDREAGVVISAVLARVILGLVLLILVVAFLPMNVTDLLAVSGDGIGSSIHVRNDTSRYTVRVSSEREHD